MCICATNIYSQNVSRANRGGNTVHFLSVQKSLIEDRLWCNGFFPLKKQTIFVYARDKGNKENEISGKINSKTQRMLHLHCVNLSIQASSVLFIKTQNKLKTPKNVL